MVCVAGLMVMLLADEVLRGKIARRPIGCSHVIGAAGERGGVQRGYAAGVQRARAQRGGPAIEGHGSPRRAGGGAHRRRQGYVRSISSAARRIQCSSGRGASHRQCAVDSVTV